MSTRSAHARARGRRFAAPTVAAQRLEAMPHILPFPSHNAIPMISLFNIDLSCALALSPSLPIPPSSISIPPSFPSVSLLTL